MIRVRTNYHFEMAHRLHSPNAPERCRSIHGHRWEVEWCIDGGDELDKDGMVAGQFAPIKRALRGMVDAKYDHALALSGLDPMAEAVRGVYPDQRFVIIPWELPPTTETLALELLRDSREALIRSGINADVVSLVLRETHANAVEVR